MSIVSFPVESFGLSQALVDEVKVPLRRGDTAFRAVIHIYIYEYIRGTGYDP